jgi:hypothetical protein
VNIARSPSHCRLLGHSIWRPGLDDGLRLGTRHRRAGFGAPPSIETADPSISQYGTRATSSEWPPAIQRSHWARGLMSDNGWVMPTLALPTAAQMIAS